MQQADSKPADIEAAPYIQRSIWSSVALWCTFSVVGIILMTAVTTFVKFKVKWGKGRVRRDSEDNVIQLDTITCVSDVQHLERNETSPLIQDDNVTPESNTTSSQTRHEHGSLEIDLSKLTFKGTSILGSGEFGEVREAYLEDITLNPGGTKVAVKSLKGDATEKDKQNFMQEIEIMKSFGRSHSNVISLLGCCTKTGSLCIIMEMAPNGSLQNYLRSYQSNSTYQNLHANNQNISRFDLLQFAWQIAQGMNFLASHQCIHRDLATRNVLLGVNNICKISDFGFARKDSGAFIYERHSGTKLPLRWMAIESLCECIYTSKSDVWSYGITLWEIVTLGSTPYGHWSSSQVLKMLKRGYREPKPKHCSKDIYALMLNCWNSNPTERPSFADLHLSVGKLANDLSKEYLHMQDFESHKYVNLVAVESDSEEKL
ncbi:tyrosine kinase receptor Cad96Ca-like [Ptychodera flava]|uniref:tyrosine kinase receptor Cad96Ca-like n=1 Tax=Ptychodera flava TaxID=63121 RepID=UPI00396A0287